ncbi:MAG TPA: AI-2E family transporter [Chthoniobacterales bacterium]|jgi:predicted PurR-regulated permease PerM
MAERSTHEQKKAAVESHQLALRSVLTILGVTGIVVIVLYLLRNFASALLLIFAGILFGIFLGGLTNLAMRWLRLPRWLALTVATVALAGAFALFIFVAGPRVAAQTQQLSRQLPDSIPALQKTLRRYDWGRALLGNLPSLDQIHFSMVALIGSVTQVFSITAEMIGAIVFIFFVGLYLAASPEDYMRPALLLLAAEHRARGREVFEALGRGLGRWLVGRFVTMVSLGALTALALWLLGIPLALVLGVIAGLLLFVPYLGAVAAAIPALLVALIDSPAKVLWVACIYIAVHGFEGYCITPFVQRRAVALPPALLLSVQLLSASLFGLAGVVFSTPLVVVAIVLVQMLYVQGVLGEKVAVLGEHGTGEAKR